MSGAIGSKVTFRIAEIAVPKPGDPPRGPHLHDGFEECIYVLKGTGTTVAESGEIPIKPGDIVLIPPNEKHMTRNTGTEPLVLLCFFAEPDVIDGHHRIQELLKSPAPCPIAFSAFAPKPISRASMPPRRRAFEVAYHAPTDAAVAALMKVERRAGDPGGRAEARAGAVRGRDSSSSCRSPAPASTGSIRPALTRLGIPVANVAGGSNSAVAEYAVTTASMLLRRFAWADAEIKAGNYAKFRARMIADNLAGIEGLLVGLVGFGTIGRAVAQAFQRMGAKVCFFDPAPADAALAASLDARPMSLDELLATSDVVSLHVPLLPATQNLIGAAQLARMKPGAMLIQGSRGGIVDEAALAASLTSGHLGGAAVDVYSTEPPAADNPLLKLSGEAASRLLLTPHIAGVTRQSSAILFRSAWQNVERVLVQKQPPLNRVY